MVGDPVFSGACVPKLRHPELSIEEHTHVGIVNLNFIISNPSMPWNKQSGKGEFSTVIVGGGKGPEIIVGQSQYYSLSKAGDYDGGL